MQSTIEIRRRFSTHYQIAARVMGWMLLAGGVIWLLVFVFWILAAINAAGEMRWPGTSRNIMYVALTFLLSFAAPGLLALLVAQFIKYASDARGCPGWILRHGPWLLYGCAFVLAVKLVLNLAGWELPMSVDADRAGLLFLGPSSVPLLAKVLICIGLGQALRWLLPVIDDFKMRAYREPAQGLPQT